MTRYEIGQRLAVTADLLRELETQRLTHRAAQQQISRQRRELKEEREGLYAKLREL